ncbi:MAG: aspartyl protease family protein [Bacteroidales bacterium]|nr:aspartyl protease family protein [Bacteroidales bacterium]
MMKQIAIRFFVVIIIALISSGLFSDILPQFILAENEGIPGQSEGLNSNNKTISAGDPEPLGDFTSLSIPLKRAGRLLLIEADIDGVQGNLIFDTGATGMVLNKTYFRKHSLLGSTTSNGITGSTGEVEQALIEKIVISELSFEKTRVDIADLGHLENQRNIKIIGLFGYKMIKSFEVVIDVSLNELQLHKIDKKGDRIQKPDIELPFDYVQKIDPWRPVLILKGKIAGKSLNFCFDTGAETNAINSHSSKNVLSTVSILRRSNLRGAGQASNEVLYGIMNDFCLDNTVMKNMETIIVNLDALCEVYELRIDGMLGFSFLEKGVITINLAKKQFGMSFFKPKEL